MDVTTNQAHEYTQAKGCTLTHKGMV